MNVALRKMREVGFDRNDRLALAFIAACGVAIGSGILASLIYLLLDISSMVRMRPAVSQKVLRLVRECGSNRGE
jgi:hypothetical protein